MNSLTLLKQKRQDILAIAARHGVSEVRVFGSVVRGEERPDSDIDFLVKRTGKTSRWFPAGLIMDLEKLLGRRIEIVTDNGLNPLLREHVIKEAIHL